MGFFSLKNDKKFYLKNNQNACGSFGGSGWAMEAAVTATVSSGWIECMRLGQICDMCVQPVGRSKTITSKLRNDDN